MQHGFTLVELMVTLAVAAVLLTVGIPETINFMMTNRLATQSNDILVSVSLARSEALKRASNVVVCTSSNGTSCSGSNDWEGGWMSFVDTDGGNDKDAGEPVLSLMQPFAFAPGTKIDVGSPLISQFTFLSNGLPNPITGGSILICDSRATTTDRVGKRQIEVVAGRIRVIQPSTATICN